MKKFLITSVIVLAIALVAYLAYKKWGKPVEETEVVDATTIGNAPLTTGANITDLSSGEIAQVTLDAQRAAVQGGDDEAMLVEGRKINQA